MLKYLASLGRQNTFSLYLSCSFREQALRFLKREVSEKIFEVAVQQMAEEGIDAQKRAIALGFHMQSQAEIAMPTAETAAIFKQSLAKQ